MCILGTRKLRLYVPSDTSMAVQRFYIYRCGATNARALTGDKSDLRLPAPLAHDHWQFWMQTSCHQTEEGLHGFGMETAVTQITARGYYLFAGSPRLLATRHVERATTPQVSIIATDTEASSAAQ
jgi:hypothetical protein